MTIGSSLARFRSAIARRLARARALRSRAGMQALRSGEPEPAAAPPSIPLPPDPAALTPPDLMSLVPIAPIADEAIGATSIAPASDAATSGDPAIAVGVAPEIRIARAPGRFETDAELGLRPKLYDAK